MPEAAAAPVVVGAGGDWSEEVEEVSGREVEEEEASHVAAAEMRWRGR